LSNKGIVDDLVATIQGRWKKGIRNNIKGGIFLSLLDPHLRQFTLDNLVLSFVGETLLGLYRKASGNEPK
jgi:hypothetical protein